MRHANCGGRIETYSDGYFLDTHCVKCGKEVSDLELVDEVDDYQEWDD